MSWTDLVSADVKHFSDLLDDPSRQDQDTVDELGFGKVRDFYSDVFFPGITTLLTRARYITLVPALMSRLGRISNISSRLHKDPDSCLHDWERVINDHFKKLRENGAIGKVSRDRRFTEIYWPVLSKLDMIREEWNDFSMPEFVERLGRPEPNTLNENKESIGSTREEPWESELTDLLIENPILHFTGANLTGRCLSELTLDLTRAEANYLRARFEKLGSGNAQDRRVSLWQKLIIRCRAASEGNIQSISEMPTLKSLAAGTTIELHAKNAIMFSRFARTMYIAYWYHVAKITSPRKFAKEMEALQEAGLKLASGLAGRNIRAQIEEYIHSGLGNLVNDAKKYGQDIAVGDLPNRDRLHEWLQMLPNCQSMFDDPGLACLSSLESRAKKGSSRSRLMRKKTLALDLEKTLRAQTRLPLRRYQYYYRLQQAVTIARDIAHPNK